MHIDSPLPSTQQVFTPVRPDPVPPGLETQRPVAAPNGAEAGARHPLDEQDRSTRADRDSREQNKTSGQKELTPDQQREVEQLKARDREVRAHEQAHKAAAGQHARGGPSYEYQQGPDGKRYAVGGEVSIDTSRTGDPQRDLEKARTIRQAALAPAQPSAQDRRVAAEANAMEINARQELQAETTEKLQEKQSAAGEHEAGNSTRPPSESYAPQAARHRSATEATAPVGEYLDVFT